MRTRSLLLAVFIGALLPNEPYGSASHGSFQGVPAAGFASEEAFLEVQPRRSLYYPGETIHIEVRFGFAKERFDALVPLFRRELDLSLQVHAPWADGTACATLIPEPDSRAESKNGAGGNADTIGLTFALNEAVRRATRAQASPARAGEFVIFETGLLYRATCPGEILLAPASLRYAHSGERHVDPFGREVALEREVETITSGPTAFTILPFPEAGRPPDFQGAVGQFDMRREASFRSGGERDRADLTVTVEGLGTVLASHAPDLDSLPGIHVLSSSHTPLFEPRFGSVFRYELERDPHVRSLPAFRFVYFDTGPEPGYRTLTSEPIPWPRPTLIDGPSAVRPTEPGGPSEAPTRPRTRELSPHYLWALLPLALMVLLVRKRPARQAGDPLLGTAVDRFREALQAGKETGASLDQLLATLLDRNPSLLTPQEVRSALTDRGIGPEAAGLAADLHEAAHSASYGGSPDGPDRAEALRLAERLLP